MMDQRTFNAITQWQSLIDWLRAQPADEEYVYIDNNNCPLARYYGSKSSDFVSARNVDIIFGPNKRDPMADENKSFRLPRAFNVVMLCGPHKYGAALGRVIEAMENGTSLDIY